MCNIRIEVPCTEVTKAVLFTEYGHRVTTTNTINQNTLNVDVVSFDSSTKKGADHYRKRRIKILLNKRHSERYSPGITEKAFAQALEEHAAQIVNSRMWGIFLANRCVRATVNIAWEDLGIIETEFEKDSMRKMFYRYRLRKEKNILPRLCP